MTKSKANRSRREGEAARDAHGERGRARLDAPAALEPSPSRRRIVEGLVVFVVAFAAYANTLHSDFTLDDIPIVKDNELIRSLGNVGKFFRTNYWGESDRFVDKSLYRPMVITSYALNYAIHGLSPFGYHLVNVMLNAGASVLLYALVWVLLSEARAALIAGVLFAVHPIHTEAIAGIVGRAEIMALLGGLWCCLAYVIATREDGPSARRKGWVWVAVSVVGYAFGIFSKEIGFMGPFLILLWEWVLPQRRRLFRADPRAVAAFAGFTLVVLVWSRLRASAISSAEFANVAFFGTTRLEQLLTGLRVCMEYVGLLVAPLHLSADYWKPEVPFARSLMEPGVVAAMAMFIGFVVLIAWSWRRRPGIAWGILAFMVVLFPVSNLPFRMAVLKAERLLYSPSAGFIVAVATLAVTNFANVRLRRPVQVGAWVVAGLFLLRTWERNIDWRDDHTLAAATLETSPNSPIFNTAMAEWYRQQNQEGAAREHFLRCVEAQPRNAWALFNLGNIELNGGRFDNAVEFYQRVLQIEPRSAPVFANLGWALEELHRYREAVDALENARRLRPDHPAAYVNALSIYIQLQDVKAALPVLEEALRRFPSVPAVHWNAGGIYLLAGRKADSEAAYRRAQELDPNIAGKKAVDTSMD